MAHLDPDLLSAYIDHELPTTDVAAVERHLADCGACRAEFEELRGLSTLVRELPVYQPRRAVDVSAHSRGGSDTLAKIMAFSKPLAIAAVVLLVAFAGLRMLTDDEPDDGGDQISFSAVQPTEVGTDSAVGASQEQADGPAAEMQSDDAMDSEAPPMAALPARQSQAPATMDIVAAAPEATAAPTPVATPAGEGDSWLPVGIVATIIVVLAAAAGWYRFVRRPAPRSS